MATLSTEFVHITTRESRSRYVVERFREYLQESVLDVGCYEAPLRRMLVDVKYIGVDVAGSPDLHLDLEACSKLPFPDGHFQCVLCIEVLEHLENMHAIVSELSRVSKQFVIISLPNCWRDARRPIERGKGRIAHYGLPGEPPSDRHKWFFNVTEAKSFSEYQAGKHNLKIREMFLTEKPRPFLVRTLRRAFYSGERYLNRYSQTLWTVYEK